MSNTVNITETTRGISGLSVLNSTGPWLWGFLENFFQTIFRFFDFELWGRRFSVTFFQSNFIFPEILLCHDPNFLNFNFYFKSFTSEKFSGKYPESCPEVFLNWSWQFKILNQIRHIISLNEPFHIQWNKPMKVPYLFMRNQKASKIKDKNSKMWMGIQLRSAHGEF